MAFVNLKDLKANVGGQLRLTLNSSGVYEEKEWQGKKFNTFKYEVVQDGQTMTLDATDSLKRKLDLINTGDDFLLSWEEFTKDGRLMNYWKLEKVSKESANPQFENVKKSVNEFEQQLQKDKAVKDKVQTTNSTYTNGAKIGMIFNQTCEQFRYFECAWTQEEFVDNFNRLSAYLDACENQKEKPFELPSGEKKVEPKVEQPATYNADDLPF